ncbi:hypothetical protein [Aeromicrobium sp. CTD01-1L150]|uniref:hypothetical protein n=1 Tax=Aeromicrobium sp. CTD01-1L150 TaxID=3341830 RepID=UPI0035C1DCA5
MDTPRTVPGIAATLITVCIAAVLCCQLPCSGGRVAGPHPWHTDIVVTTFWVGEIFDAFAADGRQSFSTYDSQWERSYGGCDGIVRGGRCETETRVAANDYFPTAMTPRENPFYLDLPYDDVNDEDGFARRGEVVPWAGRAPYARHVGNRSVSLMKDRWVELRHRGRVCFAQVQDAGPGVYDDAAYVFGHDDRRPANRRFNGAGLDVSPAVNGCLGLSELDGSTDTVDWRFVEAAQVPPGPWTRLVTGGAGPARVR